MSQKVEVAASCGKLINDVFLIAIIWQSIFYFYLFSYLQFSQQWQNWKKIRAFVSKQIKLFSNLNEELNELNLFKKRGGRVFLYFSSITLYIIPLYYFLLKVFSLLFSKLTSLRNCSKRLYCKYILFNSILTTFLTILYHFI